MKLMMKLLALFFGVLMLANIANAESPREQLKQMVEQLQKTPNDNALREKIIKLAQKLKPAPAVPEEAIKYEGRGQFRFNNAKSEQDYVDAAKEYEQAVQSAPWVSGYYSDLCTIYEKAGKFAEGKRNCEFALLSITDPALIMEIKRRIAGLEVGIEISSPAAIAERKRKEGEELFRKYSGRLYVCKEEGFRLFLDDIERQARVSYEVQPNGFIEIIERRARGGSTWEAANAYVKESLLIDGNPKVRMDGARIISSAGKVWELAEDGSRITHRSSSGELYNTCYPR